MRIGTWIVVAGMVSVATAGPARADAGWTTPPGGAAPVAATAPMAARDVSGAIDAYVSTAGMDPGLVGGGGSAGYDRGFWIRSGQFSLGMTVLIQARYEAYLWDDAAAEPAPGGDLSGFSVPRSVLLLHGEAPCCVRYSALLEFGHHGGPGDTSNNAEAMPLLGTPPPGGMPNPLREGWIEWGPTPAFNARMGLVKLPSTRQLMAVAGIQQFVDVSLGASWIGHVGVGYQDRNRDYGLVLHGQVGACRELSWVFGVSNGDGTRRRNVLDGTTDDGLAFSGRLDWDVVGQKGYAEGAVGQNACEWTASLGAFGQFRPARTDRPHLSFGDQLVVGADAAGGYGGFSATLAAAWAQLDEVDVGTGYEGYGWIAQAGYLFPGTPWEVAARWTGYVHEVTGGPTWGAQEYAAAVNYYRDGHRDKLTLDVAWIQATDDGNVLIDVMSGYNANAAAARDSDALLLRFQWQLIL